MDYVMKAFAVLFGLGIIYQTVVTSKEAKRLASRREEVKELMKFLRKEEACD